MDFVEEENKNGVRFTWNYLPETQEKLQELMIPLACIYSPFKQVECPPRLNYKPLMSPIGSVLSPQCQIQQNNSWYCPFSNSSNRFPSNYADMISQGDLPPECEAEMTTVEYCFDDVDAIDNTLIFVIDLAVKPSEVKAIKNCLKETFSSLPDNVSIAIITFTRYIQVYEMNNTHSVKSLIIDGKEDVTIEKIHSLLDISRKSSSQPNSKFFCNVQQNLDHVLAVVDSLQSDPWLCMIQGRPYRALGAAVKSGIALSESFKCLGARMAILIGGPPTIGKGVVASTEKANMIRAHFNLEKGDETAQIYEASLKFYDELTPRLIENNTTVDVFGFSVDQFGIAEMREMVKKTGGFCVIQEEFVQQVFQDTFRNVYALNEYDELKIASGAHIKVLVSKPLKIKGAIGPLLSLNNKSSMAAKEVVGQGNTNEWYLGGLDPCLSISFVLDIDEKERKEKKRQNIFIQFITTFKHPSGYIAKRVTSLTRPFMATTKNIQYLSGVDQEAVIALYAKLAAEKSFEMDPLPVMRWLDRHLILIIKKFSLYTKGKAQSFNMCEELQLLPQFFYYLRKSFFVRKFASSLDEAVYYRLCMERENTSNCLVMIQPSLTQYDLESEYPTAALCDIGSLREDVVLLMDCYFYVVTWYGATIREWINEGYQELEDYAHFKEMLKMPGEDTKLLIQDRLCVPKITEADQGSGNERLFKSRLNPSGDATNPTTDDGNFITDDKSLRVFMEHLIKAITSDN